MKILVYDVAAEYGGAVTVLRDFYREVLEKSPRDIQWVFVVSQPVLEDTPQVKILRFSKPKKSRLHRLAFEHLDLPKILAAEKPDAVISLQNMPVARYGGRQFVLLHQSLQFCDRTFSFLKGEERSLAVQQRIICRIYRRTLPRAEHVFVQTRWMKEDTMRWLGWPEDKISVVPSRVRPPRLGAYTGTGSRTFFYPAGADRYKNHDLVIAACKLLAGEGITDYRVIFTLPREGDPDAERIIRAARGLPIEFVGSLPHETVWEYYSGTVLLFPSYLETCGLPLVEARAAGAWILASDLPFAREVLEGYPNKAFFPYDGAEVLAQQMKAVLGGVPWQQPAPRTARTEVGLMESMLNIIKGANAQ